MSAEHQHQQDFTLHELLGLGVYRKEDLFIFEGKMYEKLYGDDGKLEPLFTDDGNFSRYRVVLGVDDYDYVATDSELEKKLDEFVKKHMAAPAAERRAAMNKE